MTTAAATAIPAETQAPDDRRYCNDPDCPNWQNFPYGLPDEHVTEFCTCQFCEERGQKRMSAAQRYIHGIYEKRRRDGFRLMRCAVADCDTASFVPSRVLAEHPGPWRCGMHLFMGVRA